MATPPTNVWNAYLPIGGSLKSDQPPDADLTWLSSHGIDADALVVLRCVRQHVLPLVRSLEKRRVLRAYSFLIHDRTSGVPCPPEDHSVYVHLRLQLGARFSQVARVRELLPKAWVYLTRVSPTVTERRVHELLDAQSAWYLQVVERESALDDLELLKLVRQHLHFWANMSQMRIS